MSPARIAQKASLLNATGFDRTKTAFTIRRAAAFGEQRG